MISEPCPFGKAVLGRVTGEIVSINVGGQRCRVTIVGVSDSTTGLAMPFELTATPIGLR
jgi:hypothetical protein